MSRTHTMSQESSNNKGVHNVLNTYLNCLVAFATCTRLDHFLCCFVSFSVEVILQSKISPETSMFSTKKKKKTGLNDTRMGKEQILILKNY